jgi:hypothetical protein
VSGLCAERAPDVCTRWLCGRLLLESDHAPHVKSGVLTPVFGSEEEVCNSVSGVRDDSIRALQSLSNNKSSVAW